MNKLIKRNYDAVVKRGKITEKTNDVDFLWKAREEWDEAWQELYPDDGQIDQNKLTEEIGDTMVVCMNWLTHRGVDIDLLLTQIAIKNETRED